jgi:hypothetical protein
MPLARRHFLQGAATTVAAATLARAAKPPLLSINQSPQGVFYRWSNDNASYPMTQFHVVDEAIKRPFFANLCLPFSDHQLTRNFPLKSDDPADHPTMHPGIWLAFGDINGHDFWRNKGRVIFEKYLRGDDVPPDGFAAVFRYEGTDGAPLAQETLRCGFTGFKTPGVRLKWDSKIEALDRELVFGDQEEMGLGVRVATDLIVKNGGSILDSAGREGEKGIWGKTANWCRYGTRHKALLLMAHPDNFRPCRWHVRDYGLMVANPFADQAFDRTKPPAKTVVKPGESLRLRFAITMFHDPKFDLAAEYKSYVADSKG